MKHFDVSTHELGPFEESSHFDSTRLLSYHSDSHLALEASRETPELEEMSWNAKYRLLRVLGRGAQGIVYLAHREGVDGYSTRVAVKLYYRHKRQGEQVAEADAAYGLEMRRIARQAQKVSQIQNDHLVNIRDFVSVDETRVMVMEWIDGLDLQHLLDLNQFGKLRERLNRPEWERLNDVVVSPGVDHCRLKPGVAVDILRGCLAGLSSLHHEGVAHCDVKPANIMIKRTGTKKLIDVDSSCVPHEDDELVRGTPYYMAPEQLRDRRVSLRSDIASLGYILIEMLTGRLLFKQCENWAQLLEAKAGLSKRLPEILPHEVRRNEHLLGLCQKMVAVDPSERFPDADAAELGRLGAAAFHRQLVKSDLSSEYDRELAGWLDVYPAGGAG